MNRGAHIRRFDGGFTLIEILMAVVVIGILATVAMRAVQSSVERSRFTETQNEMAGLAWGVAGNTELYANGMRSDFGYVGDIGAVPASLDNLVTNPGSYATWNGPYVSKRFTEDTDGFKKDAWGNTYTFSNGITISSTGGGSQTMTKNVASAASDLTSTTVVGTVTDAAGNPPGDSSVAVTVTVTYPDGAGGTTTSSVNPGSGGSFSIGSIPIGIRTVEAVYRATNDTVIAYAAVLPRDGATLGLRLPSAPFAASPSGGGSGSITYVNGSAQVVNNNRDIQFDITNSGTASVNVASLVATYSENRYYRRIKWDGNDIFDENNPRAGSGDTATFTSSQTLAVGQTITVILREFQDAPTGGSWADMADTDMTITFSEGSVINFNSGP